jgi:putative spermidine/putrescine transport system substrate-binding protein
MITRRSVVAGAALSGAMLVSGPLRSQDRRDLTNMKLQIATYGGSWRDAIVEHIAKPLVARGLETEYILGSPEDSISRIIAAKRQGQVPFDVLSGFPLVYGQAINANFLAPIDASRLANAKNVPAGTIEGYQVTTAFSPDCIVYNVEKLQQAKIEPPKRYSDLADPRLQGRVAFPDTGHVQHWAAVVGLARENGGDESNPNVAIEIINRINPAYYYATSVDLASRFSAGDIWIAPWTAGWAVRLKRGNVPVDVIYAKFGDRRGALWPSIQWAVAGSQHIPAVYAYIDSWLTVDGPAKFCDATGTVPVGTEARAIMRQDPLNRAMLLLGDSDIANAYRVDWGRFNDRRWREAWARNVKR